MEYRHREHRAGLTDVLSVLRTLHEWKTLIWIMSKELSNTYAALRSTRHLRSSQQSPWLLVGLNPVKQPSALPRPTNAQHPSPPPFVFTSLLRLLLDPSSPGDTFPPS